MQYKESPVICGICVYPLKKLGFSMVHYILYSVNQAINDKRSVIKKKILFTKCDINNTYKSSGIHVHTSHYKYYCISYSGCNQDVPNFTIENEQQISRVSSYMYFKFGQASMNWKKLIFKVTTDVYFSYSNSK